MKLFDFGLAKEMRPEDLVSDDLYDMSGNTGMYHFGNSEVLYLLIAQFRLNQK